MTLVPPTPSGDDFESSQVFFQPILELGREVLRLLAFEGFCHHPSQGTDRTFPAFPPPNGVEGDSGLDLACLRQVLAAGADLPEPAMLSLNIQLPTLILHPEFPDLLLEGSARSGIPLTRIILEINTDGGTGHGSEPLDLLQDLRSHGVQVALDGLGVGTANLDHILELRPDILKLSPLLTQGLLRDPFRQAILEALVDMTRKTGGRILAKNLESVEDFRIARWMGVTLFQGYLFAVPGPISLWKEHPFPQEWHLRSFMRRPARLSPPEVISPDKIH